MVELVLKEEAYRVVGACMTVHRELGPGFLEAVYQEALEYELEAQGIPFQSEQALTIQYRDHPLRKQYFADFVCFETVIIEVKAVKALLPEHEAQLFNYLKATRLPLGILVNFGEPSLHHKRIVCTTYFQTAN